MNKHDEFLGKLAALMKEYNAEINADYSEGCECCGGDYTITIETGGGEYGHRKETCFYQRYIYAYHIESELQ